MRIIARVGTSFAPENPERAIQVGMHLATKAGWDVSGVEGAAIDLDADWHGIDGRGRNHHACACLSTRWLQR